jgi:hypothetical protein
MWAAASVVVLALGLPLGAQNWPMWGGTPSRNMSATVTGLPDSWDAAKKTNIKWTAELGSTSYGNPVVADGKVFVGTNNANPRNAAIQGDKGVLMCFREADGVFLWQAVWTSWTPVQTATGPKRASAHRPRSRGSGSTTSATAGS